MGHHYVPRFYLRGFAIAEAIWAYDTVAERRFPTQVKSIANETGMYSDELEDYLATKVEEPTKPAITKLRTRDRLTPEDRLALAKYILILWKRVPRARDRVLERLPQVADEVEQKLNSDLDRLVDQNPDLRAKAERRRIEIAKMIAKQKQRPSPELWHGSVGIQSGPRVVDALLSMNWLFLHSKSQFLTCDNPVFFFEQEGIARPTSELTVPISTSLALWATRQPRPSMQYLAASSACVRQINQRTAHNATRFVYARSDEPWILRFVTQRQWPLAHLR